MKKHAAAWAKGLLKYGLGFGLLAWVISKYWAGDSATGTVGLETLLERPLNPVPLVLAGLLMASALTLQLVRWFLLVRALDLPFTVRNALRLGFVGVFYNTFLPGAVGGDLLKAYFIAREQPGRKAAAVATVLIDRAMGLFGLILFVAVSGSIAWAAGDERLVANPDLQWMVKVTAVLAGGATSGYILIGFLPVRRVERFAGRLKALPKVGRSLAEMWYAVWVYRQRPRTILLGVGISAVCHLCMVFAFHFASRGFTPDNPAVDLATLPEHMVICPIGYIVQALPVSPGGVGVGEAAFAGLYKLSGRTPSTGVASRLALRVVEWVIGLCGYVVYLRMRTELPGVEDEAEKEGYGGAEDNPIISDEPSRAVELPANPDRP
ncbi:MAG: hypothetical protein JWO38_5429 [Gemmataceae bacterium]|nr:hypothetical protein [Gemmataceae bacterium]